MIGCKNLEIVVRNVATEGAAWQMPFIELEYWQKNPLHGQIALPTP
jgi:hypothetical protein